ncbi:APC family permease [Pseudoxanthomonas wuyuanensis]|uniref:Arginine/agmatine antiporter n=1 Tax=Pseudoxanthomonas wuyuanensis TaxID=1073196 RepID=A0A286D9R7_9GAMM|nr:APC family permease [Pseudoxanthomonas wuyuanensis]KAF1719493.1 amino acid permease [Pseudoxanthomonas wuyuanensis]SOD55401.1 amino acid/polyamine/organocation transporter, APC superfamily [Pseudoxanthomonas wuyuanensis]
MSAPAPPPERPGFVRAVSRWQIVGLSINDVIGSGIYLLPAATALLLGPASLWAVLLAGLAVAMLVLCYAQAASYFDEPGGSYLYAREAFGPFVGFEIGWMVWLTRIASAAALSNALADAVARFWPAAGSGGGRLAIVVGSLGLLTLINVIGIKSAARTGVALVIGKLLPLLLFVGIGMFYVDWSFAISGQPPDLRNLGEAALLLLFAYAGFENIPAAAGEFKNPRRDVPFALMTMIATVTLIYAAVQLVAQGTLPGLAQSQTPLADASAVFSGETLALILTVGATISILGTNSNTMLLGPRVLYALAHDGFGPRLLAGIHPRFHTPAAAIITQGALALALALSGSFVQLAMLSVVARLFAYIGTALSVLVLRRQHGHRSDVLQLPGGAAIPVIALLLSLGLLASATWRNLVAAAVALLIGALLYRFRRAPE